MKRLITILVIFISVKAFSQNYFVGVNWIRDTLKIGENGGSHIGVIKFYGNGSGSIRLRTFAAAGDATLYLTGSDGDTISTRAYARSVGGVGGGTPGGSSGDIQYNNGGAFGGFGDWDGSILTVPGKITGLTDGSSATDAVTKQQLDAVSSGIVYKQAVRAATTTTGTLASSFENNDVIDGITLATNDRILIKNQSTQTENGIYVVAASGSPTRATDADAGSELVAGTSVFVSVGTANAGTQWTQSTTGTITLGSSNIVFVQIGSNSGALLASNNLSDLANAATARTNLGGTTVGVNIFTLANPSAIRFLKINADNSVTAESASTHLTSIGAAASGANTDITSVLLNQTGLVVKGGSANALTFKPNETLSTGRILNIKVNDADRTIDLGGSITLASSFTTSGANALTFTTTGTTNVTLPTSGTLATLSGTEFLQNKWVRKRVGTTTSTSSLTIDYSVNNYYTVTALAATMTINAPTGSPVEGDELVIRIKDNGTARSLSFTTGSSGTFRASSDLPLPTTTILGKTMYVKFYYNEADLRWDFVSYLDNF